MTSSRSAWIVLSNFSLQVILQQPCWENTDTDLKKSIIVSIWESRKPSTIEKYCLSLRKFFRYCQSNSIDLVLPLPSLQIAQYLETLKKSSTKSSIVNALTSLKWLYYFIPGLNSVNNPLNDTMLSKIVESSNRNNAKMKIRKKPLSSEIIQGILKQLPKEPTLVQLRNCLIPVLAYALLLRHDETSHLNCSHLTVLDEGIKFFIPSSKTDTYREGKFVFLAKENRSLYDLLLRYFSVSNISIGQNHFLFGPVAYDKSTKKFYIKNEKLSYDVFNKIVKEAVAQLGLNPSEFGTHSARSGGASDLAPFISQYHLMLSGRWSDPRSIGSYVETPWSTRFEISKILNINA